MYLRDSDTCETKGESTGEYPGTPCCVAKDHVI